MPTSATRPADRAPEAGLTLVEVLAALAILAVMAGATALGLGSLRRGASAEAEAKRLADRLQLAADEALVDSAPLALAWDAGGYRFLAWDAGSGEWRQSATHDLGSRHALPRPLQLVREDDRGDAPLLVAPDLPHPAVFRVQSGQAAWRVAFDGLGTAATAATPAGN